MTQVDFDRFAELIQGVAECYGQSLSAQGVILRFALLEQFDYAEVRSLPLYPIMLPFVTLFYLRHTYSSNLFFMLAVVAKLRQQSAND